MSKSLERFEQKSIEKKVAADAVRDASKITIARRRAECKAIYKPENYDDGRTLSMAKLNYDDVLEEMGSGDASRCSYAAMAEKFDVSYATMIAFCHLPKYKQTTMELVKVKGMTFAEKSWAVLQDIPEDNAQAKRQENMMKCSQWFAARFYPEMFGSKTETVVKHIDSEEEKAIKKAKLYEMVQKFQEKEDRKKLNGKNK